MITDFNLVTGNKNYIKPNISSDKSVSLFENVSVDDYREYINDDTAGISWKSKNCEILLFERNVRLFGLPSTDMSKVIVIYPMNHKVYQAPENAVIYNSDGSIHLKLKVPNLASELARQRVKYIRGYGSFHPPYQLYFDGVSWSYNSIGDRNTVIRIVFDRDWWEDRLLNTETGEFGECLNSGRR